MAVCPYKEILLGNKKEHTTGVQMSIKYMLSKEAGAHSV